MDEPSPPDEGKIAPFQSSGPRFERALISVFLGLRTIQVVQAFTCLLTSRSAYRRPRLVTLTAMVALGELLWLARRDFARGRHDATTVRVDVVFGALGLVALSLATGTEDRTSSLNWMMPLTVAGCLGSALGVGRREGAAIAAGFGTAYAASTWDSISGGSGRAGTAIANTVSYPGFFLIGDYTVRQVRRMTKELDEARRLAVEQSSRAAAEAARNREHRLLHDSAVQTLDAIAAGYELDPENVRRQARKEAATLRRAIAGEEPEGAGLIAGLDALASEFFERGLHVDLVVGEVDEEPDAAVADALCHACREALNNVAKHAGVSHAVVRAVPVDHGIRMTIRDQGVGFDPSLERRDFGLENSIVSRLEEVRGRAEISSSPGRGTKVEIWAPM